MRGERSSKGRPATSDDEDFHSPGSPARDGNEWEDMQAWAEEHEGDCEVEGGELALRAAPKAGPGERQLPRPSAPSLSAHRTGDSILIR